MSIRLPHALLCAIALVVLAPVAMAGEEPVKPKFDPDHRSEAEQLLGSARDAMRVEYSKTGVPPKKLTDGKNFKADDFKGTYFSVTNKVYTVGDKGEKGALTAEPVDVNDGYGILVFWYASGRSEISWYDTLEALKKAQDTVDFDDDVEEPAEATDAQAQWDALYKEGANWTNKTSGGILVKTEVTEVEDGVAKLKVSINFGGNWMEPTENEAARPETSDAEVVVDEAWKETGKGEEKVKVGDREIEAIWIEGTYNGQKVRNVTSKKYGLVIKAELDGKVVIELTEFNPKD